MATNANKTSIQDREFNKFDKYTNALVVISEPHHLTHVGLVFHSSHKHTGLANLASEDILIRVPSGSYPHMNRIKLATGGGNIDILIYEGADIAATGSAISAYNTNRNSTLTPNVTLFEAPTVTTYGTEIHRQWLPPAGAGVGMSAQGVADAEAGEEWILAPSTDYIIQITNNSGDAIDFLIEILWYELRYKEL